TDNPTEGRTAKQEVARATPAVAPLPLLGEASSAKEMQDFLARPFQGDQLNHKLQLPAGGTIVLGKDDLGSTGPGLVFNGGTGTLVIEPKDKNSDRRPVIRIRPEANSTSGLWAALKVQSGNVELRGLRFEIEANLVSSITMAALFCQGGRIKVEDCEFVQSLPPEDGSSRLSAVEVAESAGAAPVVTFNRCCFLRAPQEATAAAGLAGQNVVTLTAAGSVDLTDCAFGPHAAVVAFQGAGPDAGLDGARARLTHCTALLNGDAAVVRLENASRCDVSTASCLFWAPGSAMEEGAPAGTLIRQVNGLSDALAGWSGQNNRYYNLAAFWQPPDADEPVRGLDAFRGRLTGTGDHERGSLVLASLPSRTEDPFQHLDADAPNDLWKAFQPDWERADLRDEPNKKHLIGVEHLLDAKTAYTDNLPPLPKPGAVVARGRRVVDPSVKVASNGVYPTLAAAVVDARPGDVIELRFNGPQTVSNAIRLDLPDLADLTIRPYADYHPVLVLGPTNPEDEEAALFRLYDGKLRLEHLQLQLRPSNDTASLQAVVCLVGDGSCSFSDCVVTLEQTNGTRLAAVAVADLPAAMKDNRMARTPGQRAGAGFKNCVVRGDGDLIADRAGRPVNVDGDNVLLALGGSVLNLEAAGDDLPAAFAGASASLKLAHATAYLGGNLVHFRADRDVRGLVPVQVSPSNCLFLAVVPPPPNSTSRPLIHLDGPDTSDDRMKQLLQWTGQGNAYSYFSPMLDQAAGGGEMPAMPYTQGRWQELTKETDAVFDRVKLVEGPTADFALAQAKPGQFRVRTDSDQQGYGADVAQLALLFPADDMSRSDK
ncbi:MAG TPA: hypothetical protein VJ739_18200, partial [Gemmataceae bacterium]|nr:hypothetical protein [Gemmataceae bacterium]